jgi:hypothetical protein
LFTEPFFQSIANLRESRFVTWTDQSDATGAPCLLRLSRERRGDGPSQRGQQEAAAVHHSIT